MQERCSVQVQRRDARAHDIGTTKDTLDRLWSRLFSDRQTRQDIDWLGWDAWVTPE